MRCANGYRESTRCVALPQAGSVKNALGPQASPRGLGSVRSNGSTSPGVTDNQRAVGGLTEGTDLRDATGPGVTDNQTAIGGLTEGTNLRDVGGPRVTDNQTAIGGLTEGTNLRDVGGVGREGQANGSH